MGLLRCERTKKEKKSKNGSYTIALPPSLHKRVSKLIQIDETSIKHSVSLKEQTVKPSTDEKLQMPELKLNIEPRCDQRPLPNLKTNWLDEFRAQIRKDRIKWNSKLYQFEKQFESKTLYEQIDELMDIAASDFTDWINKLSSDENNKMHKEMIKTLFSISIEDDVSQSLNIQMKHQTVVPQEIANIFDCSGMSIECAVQKILANDKRVAKAPVKHIAFGRTLPPSLRRLQTIDIVPLTKPNFPEEIRTGKVLFQGIDHLKSTKALITYLHENKHIRKPEYLLDIGGFDKNTVSNEFNRKPLYTFFC